MYIGKTRLGDGSRNYYRGSLANSDLSWFERLWHHFWVGSLMFMVLLGISLVLLIGYLVALSTPIFKLEDVGFQGIKRVSQAELLHQGGLVNRVNLLALNLNEVKRKMESVPWVKTVYLHRIFPNKLQVIITEHQPIFMVLAQQELYFLNNEGILFKKAESNEGGSLPLLTGLGKKDWTPEGRLNASVLKELVILQTYLSQGRDPLYPAKLSEIHYDPDCGFSLFTMERGIRITLGKEELETRIKRLEKVWAEIEKRPNLYTLKGISLQFGQRVIVHGLKPKSLKGA
ncbi:MAG: FtsQ-type POTRA domain-containing protein [Syntrophales bacterium LBB04]|nr:FtsQ-type POTRA domain-containing protein [Syntrophales bacterium LBB04]